MPFLEEMLAILNFEFDQDLRPRPGPKLAKNARKKVDKRTIVSSNYFEAAVLMNIPNNSDTCTNSYCVDISSPQKLCHFQVVLQLATIIF